MNVAVPKSAAPLDLTDIQAQFPILAQRVRGQRLAYLDNAATTQKPLAMLRALDHYYRHDNANVHRAMHELAERATAAYEHARDVVAAFIAAPRDEIVFTRGTTEGINLVARCFASQRLGPDDEILLTEMEHHSNIVPWQLVAEATGARIVVARVCDDGRLDFDDWCSKLSSRTRLAALTHISNTLGTVNPIAELTDRARQRGVPVLIDGAQAVAHLPVDVRRLGADFYAFSSHKLYGPTGFGVLWAKREHLETMPPWHGGGDMIETVTFERSTWNEIPYKFEAGTPDIAGAVGLAAAIDWLSEIGIDRVGVHEQNLTRLAIEQLGTVPGLRTIGSAAGKTGIFSFTLDGTHAQDVGSILDMQGVAVRVGHHCTMPLLRRFGVDATVRASLAVYNGPDDVDQLVRGLSKARELLR